MRNAFRISHQETVDSGRRWLILLFTRRSGPSAKAIHTGAQVGSYGPLRHPLELKPCEGVLEHLPLVDEFGKAFDEGRERGGVQACRA